MDCCDTYSKIMQCSQMTFKIKKKNANQNWNVYHLSCRKGCRHTDAHLACLFKHWQWSNMSSIFIQLDKRELEDLPTEGTLNSFWFVARGQGAQISTFTFSISNLDLSCIYKKKYITARFIHVAVEFWPGSLHQFFCKLP